MKCLSKEPGERYGTATQLAEDLARWSAGEPVTVRAAGWVERAAKWARRKPTLAAAYGLAALSVALVGIAVGAVRLMSQAEAERGTARAAQGDAEKARDGEQSARKEAEKARDGEKIARHDEERARARGRNWPTNCPCTTTGGRSNSPTKSGETTTSRLRSIC